MSNLITPQENNIKIEKEIDVTIVQKLVKPDPSINTEYPLFFHHAHGHAGFNSARDAYFVEGGATICFDSYFNAFPAHLYDLSETHKVGVKIKASGRFFVQVMMARHNRSWERLYQGHFDMNADKQEWIDLPNIQFDGLVFIEIAAQNDTFIEDIDYIIFGEKKQDVSLTAVITTFKRNDAVQRTGQRLQKYFENNPDLLEHFQLLVIDNGGDTDTIPFAKGRVIKNRNLGGAGGFTRGLLEASEKRLSTHVLFMDDDASFFPESLRRSISVLQFSNNEKRAVAGAMITESHKWRMWENGATFDRACHPIDNGRDLRVFGEVLAMSVGQPRHVKNKYAGWWYFCFPISAVKVWPFPFFVRGDDSYFSLSNDFEIITVPGVVAHQEDFFTKQTPLTIYLDMRYHIVHHLTFDDIELGPKNLKTLVKRYFDRFNNSYHYESAAAINMAIADVISGREFWESNFDMVNRRKEISLLTDKEKIIELKNIDGKNIANHSSKRNNGRWTNLLRIFTLNGHLIPKLFFYKNGVNFPLDTRAIEHDTFRRPYTLTWDSSTSKGYICNVNTKKYFDNRRKFKKLVAKLVKNYADLRIDYKNNKVDLTSKDAWISRF